MRTKKLVYCGLFSAVIAIMAMISLPLQPIPLNMALLGVLLAGGILGKKYGTISVLVYILLGLCGLPVFSGFRGGVGVIAGPTGGYIASYLIIAFLTGLVYEKTRKIKFAVPVMLISVLLCYAVGTAWYCYIMKSDVMSALALCVLPFIPSDIIKIVIALIVLNKYRRMKI